MSNTSSLTDPSSLIPNNSTSALPSPASPLSWQSALWALVAIALNTMTQSSPSADTLFPDPFSLLRASPIICLADILVIFVWVFRLAVFSRTRLSFLEAVRCFTKETGLEKKHERISILTVVLFVLGPLIPFIKLNVCSGIPWTLTWSWIYMLCYIFTLVTIFCSRGTGPESGLLRAGTTLGDEKNVLLKKTTNWIYFLAYIAQFVFFVWLTKTSLYTTTIQIFIFRMFTIPIPVFITLLGPVLLFLTLKPVVNDYRRRPAAPTLNRTHTIARVLFAVAFTAGCVENLVDAPQLIPELLSREVGGPLFPIFWLVALVVFIFGGITLLSSLLERTRPNQEISARNFPHSDAASVAAAALSDRKRLRDQIRTTALQLLFALFMLTCSLAYYWQIYDPQTTLKPGWADVFG